MNVTRFDTMLANMLGDASGDVYPAAMRLIAMSQAARAFSRFKSNKRRYGTGAVHTDQVAGQNTLKVVGGPFAVGAEITIEPGTAFEETATIQSITRPAPTDNLVGFPLTLTLTANLTTDHPSPAQITQSSLGLAIVAGTDTYVMPYDFIQPDQKSWDIATGARRWTKRSESFYDGVYRESRKIGGTGYGMAATFRPGGYGGFVGVPAGATGSLAVPSSSQSTQFTFVESEPTRLIVTPVPQSSVTYDFLYVAQHLPAEVPDWAMDALLDYAKAECYGLRISALGQGMDWSDGVSSEKRSPQIQALQNSAAAALASFDSKIRKLPMLVSG